MAFFNVQRLEVGVIEMHVNNVDKSFFKVFLTICGNISLANNEKTTLRQE